MATNIRDLKEMGLEELTNLYLTIYSNISNRHSGHDIPTLDLIRAIILWKVTGEAYADYCEIVEEVGEGDFESENSVAVSAMDFRKVFRKKHFYGIGDELRTEDFNKSIVSELQTVSFLEERDTKEDSEKYIRLDIIKEREYYLNDKFDRRIITREELNELRQIRLHNKNN
jgi:hypothetical protein